MPPKRILFFCDAPASISPSVQVNASQFSDYFLKRGWELEILPPASSKTTKFLKKIKGLHWLYCKTLLPVRRRWQIVSKIRPTDIVVVHKTLTQIDTPPTLEAKLRKRHDKIVFNFDDAVNEAGFDYLDKRIELSDAVWVGNEELVSYSRKFSSNVALIRSAIDIDHYSPKKSYERNQTPTLVWCGTPYSFKYLKLLEQPLSRLRKRLNYNLLVIARERFQFSDSNIPCTWIPYSKENELHSLRSADIALMPLSNGAYERAKENYKVKMYLSMGLPTICSPVGINTLYVQHEQNGLLASSDEEWETEIQRLLLDESLRESIGKSGRKSIEYAYSIDLIGNQLTNLFEDMLKQVES